MRPARQADLAAALLRRRRGGVASGFAMIIPGVSAPAALPAYCERTGPGPWAEPLDAVSNLAYLVAAAVALRAWRRVRPRDGPLLLLAVDAAAIGLGSLAFHVAPGPLTWAGDVWPIRLYALGHLALALRRLGGVGALATLGALAALAAGTSAATWAWPAALAGGVGYLPVLAALTLLGGWLARRPGPPERRAAGRSHLAAAAIFAVALAVRTVDRAACAAFPAGTHFLWHLLTALTVALLLLTLVRASPPPGPARQ
jgi:hypothetical protein